MNGVVRRWVVKAGSSIVCSGGPLLVRAWMEQVARLRRDHGIEVVWVTSGAIATAAERTGSGYKDRTLAEKQALSAIGQPLVMDVYNLSLQRVGLMGGQVLLTAHDLQDGEPRRNLINTLSCLLTLGAVPVLNENDATATEEIQFGDNDRLSALVAVALGAERLVLLTDVPGLYDRDPSKSSEARLIPYLNEVPDEVLALASGNSGSGKGRGGMSSKLTAARDAWSQGVPTWIVPGEQPAVLTDLAGGRKLGTQIGGTA